MELMNRRNYQKELDRKIAEIQEAGTVPTLLLHACCAPCSSYVMEYLSAYFRITVFFYNPNITDHAEYEKRVAEEKRLIGEMDFKNPVSFLEGRYDPAEFFHVVEGLEDVPEGGERCRKCFRLRLDETARVAAENGFDYFTTSLSISPLKNAELLNETGEASAMEYGVHFLNSDFKKKNGYKRSLELSAEYHLYRQNYCGCGYSRRESERRRQERR